MAVDLAAARSIVGSSALLAHVPPHVAGEALARLEFLEFAPGDKVLVESGSAMGEMDRDLYVLIEGQLVASRAMPGGRTQRLSTMASGEFFGELARVDEGVRSATVSAATPVVVARLPGAAVDRLVADAPVVMATIAAMIARRLRAADEARLSAQLNEERLSVIGRAAAMLVHDLTNPLGVVKNTSVMIEEGIGEPIEWAKRSRNAAEFMLDMVKDLLEFAKGDRIYAKEPVTLRDVVDDVESFGLVPLEATGSVAVKRSPVDDVTLLGDRRALSRALLNIVKNAADAMVAGGTLTFKTEVSEGVARIVVADTGPGIPERILPTLFEPFATYGKKGGTGLGMAMTKAAIEGHGGEITVDTAVGKGTTFTVVVPLRPHD